MPAAAQPGSGPGRQCPRRPTRPGEADSPAPCGGRRGPAALVPGRPPGGGSPGSVWSSGRASPASRASLTRDGPPRPDSRRWSRVPSGRALTHFGVTVTSPLFHVLFKFVCAWFLFDCYIHIQGFFLVCVRLRVQPCPPHSKLKSVVSHCGFSALRSRRWITGRVRRQPNSSWCTTAYHRCNATHNQRAASDRIAVSPLRSPEIFLNVRKKTIHKQLAADGIYRTP